MNQLWLNRYRRQLLQQKLPPAYIERLMQELSDHFTDMMEEPMSKDAQDKGWWQKRLGTPAELALVAGQEYGKATFSRRHPMLMFGVLPPLLFLFSLMGMLTLFSLGIALVPRELPQNVKAFWASQIVHGAFYACLALSAITVCLLAKKACQSWRWVMLGCVMLGCIGGLFHIHLGQSSISLGVSWRPIFLIQGVQLIFPMLIGLLTMGFIAHRRHQLQTRLAA